ncbi:MAG: hypothetical protein Q9220_004097 [cf. Caloplaca sp. 1 TL-2023]
MAAMPSPNASTTRSAGSPQVLVPITHPHYDEILAPKAKSLQSPSIQTQKEWVIPPRPKPGRKPAADTPPTKRKAQNRQAQRAFRERRAARVGELEEVMKKMEEEDFFEQKNLRSRVRQLEEDLDSYGSSLLLWQRKWQESEAKAVEEKRLRKNAESELAIFKDAQKQGTEAVPLPPRRSNRHKQQGVGEHPPKDFSSTLNDQDLPFGCGKCSQSTHCECIEQAFDISNIAINALGTASKRPHSPPADEDNKRLCAGPENEGQDTEIDFTARFSSKKPPKLITSTSISTLIPANPDPCGFCQEGTPCICAEIEYEANRSRENRTDQSQSFITVDESSTSPPSNPCINGPGSCDKCLSDANSTFFCKSLAATRRSKQPTMAQSNDNQDELPLTPHSPNFPESTTTQSHKQAITGPTFSCADAYETLSRHPAFDKASEELSAWMPQLATVPGGAGRTAFEVEAASVMGVLRFFDRRFGKNKG